MSFFFLNKFQWIISEKRKGKRKGKLVPNPFYFLESLLLLCFYFGACSFSFASFLMLSPLFPFSIPFLFHFHIIFPHHTHTHTHTPLINLFWSSKKKAK